MDHFLEWQRREQWLEEKMDAKRSLEYIKTHTLMRPEAYDKVKHADQILKNKEEIWKYIRELVIYLQLSLTEAGLPRWFGASYHNATNDWDLSYPQIGFTIVYKLQRANLTYYFGEKDHKLHILKRDEKAEEILSDVVVDNPEEFVRHFVAEYRQIFQ